MIAKYSSNSSCQIDSKSLQESIPYIGVTFKMITYTGDRGFGTQYGYTYMLLFSVILKLICGIGPTPVASDILWESLQYLAWGSWSDS